MYQILTELSACQIIVFLRESAIQPISIIWLIVMRHLLENIEMGTFDSICDVNNENMRHGEAAYVAQRGWLSFDGMYNVFILSKLMIIIISIIVAFHNDFNKTYFIDG